MSISKSLLSVIVTILAIGLQASGHAQGNLVNLYDWSNDTMYSGSPQNNVSILSFNAASFNGSQSTNGAPYSLALPVLTANLATGPGTTYEISFTMQNEFLESSGQTEVQFGGFTTNFDLPPARLIGGDLQSFPVNIDFTASAASWLTTMEFTVPVDTGDAISLNNFSVTEVPEISSASLFGFGGCVLLLVQQWRRLFQKRKKADH